MNKHKMTVLAGSLLLAFGAPAFAGGDKALKDQATMQTETTTAVETDTDTMATDNHGATVSEFARSQNESLGTPPDSPPGQSISQVAQSQGDWQQLDTDGDGILSDSEIQADADLTAQLDTYDGDADGQLSRAEFDAYVQGSIDQPLEANADIDADVDADVDGDLD